MKKLLLSLMALSCAWVARASIAIDVIEENGGRLITTGISSMVTIGGVTEPIGNLRVSLNISGVPTGNLYAYLVHAKDEAHLNDLGNDLVVLLNRVGRTATDDAGYRDMGLNVTFEQNMGDVHRYSPSGIPLPGPLTGAWDVDGRDVSPFAVTDAIPRTTLLSSFIVDAGGGAKDPNGLWYLFVANLGAGGAEGKLVSWGMEMNYTAVPESGTWTSGMACLFFLGFAVWFQKPQNSRKLG